MLIATRVSNVSDPPRAFRGGPTVFVRESGPGGGGGGGGSTTADPPRPALLKPAPRVSMPTPSDAIQPSSPVPAIIATGVDTVPGAPAAIDASSVVPGKGDGPGGGGGRGPGSGSGGGAGLGDGRLDGLGGDVYLPGNGVSEPVLVREVKPNYTAEALRAKVQGAVEMEAVVLADGTIDPRSIRIVRSLDPTFGLDREAVEAVKQWRFKPAIRKGRSVAVLVTLELAFTLR